MLETYDQQSDDAAKIFAEYHKRLRYYVSQARNSQRSSVDLSTEVASTMHASSEKEAVYPNVKGAKAAEDVILIETTRERNIRKACEFLALHTLDRIRGSFPAFEGSGVHSNPQLEAAKLGYDFGGEIPEEVNTVVANCLKSPPLLLQAITAYTQRLKTLITREIEKVDVRADAEALRSLLCCLGGICFPFLYITEYFDWRVMLLLLSCNPHICFHGMTCLSDALDAKVF